MISMAMESKEKSGSQSQHSKKAEQKFKSDIQTAKVNTYLKLLYQDFPKVEVKLLKSNTAWKQGKSAS